MGPAGPSSVTAEELNVVAHVNDWSMPLCVGVGRQTFGWLAEVVCRHFSASQPHSRALARTSPSLSAFTAVQVTDIDDNPFAPSQLLQHHLHDGQHLFFTLQPTTAPPPSPAPLYFLLSTASSHSFLPLELHFDMRLIPSFKESSSRELDPPALCTSLNGWRSVLPLRLHRSSLYRIHVDAPLHCHVFFTFLVQGRAVLSPDYPVVKDQWGQSLHYLHVTSPTTPSVYPSLVSVPFPAPPPFRVPALDLRQSSGCGQRSFEERVRGAEFAPSLLVTAEEERDELRVFPVSLTGHFLLSSPSLQSSLSYLTVNGLKETPPPPPLPLHVRLLNAELATSILPYLSDLLDSADKEAALCDSLHRHHLLLRSLFASYAVHAQPALYEEPGMSRVEWLSFMRICRLPDKRVTVSRLQRVYNIVKGAGVAEWGRHRVGAEPTAFDEQSGLFHRSSLLTCAEFLHALVRVAALKFKAVAGSAPATALDSLVTRHVLPFGSLWHLPVSHLRADHHHRQLSSLSTQNTQDREREKERAKEKLLYAALLQPPVLRLLHSHEQRLYDLYQALQPVTPQDLYPTSHTPTAPVFLSQVSLDSFLVCMRRERWWTPLMEAVSVDCWVDESMDEKQSEKEKEIEREKAAEREKDGGPSSHSSASTVASALSSLAACPYQLTYPEFALWLLKLSARLAPPSTAVGEGEGGSSTPLLSMGRSDSSAASAAPAVVEEAKEAMGTATNGSGGEGGEGGGNGGGGGAEEEERRREDEEAREKLRLKAAQDDALHHRHLLLHCQSSFAHLFPSAEERERRRAEEARELAEAQSREQSAKAAAAAIDKAERAAASKKKDANNITTAADNNATAAKDGKAAAAKKR